MKPSELVAETTTPNGVRLTLHRHDGQHQIRLAGRVLMSTAQTHSEEELAEQGCARLTAGQRVLIGGLGLGFTLRRTLELAPAGVRVEVAELVPAVVDWNRAHLQSVNGALIDDPRVEVRIADVAAVLAAASAGSYGAILLDVDNGPFGLVAPGNARLYGSAGLHVLAGALRSGGRAAFWSAAPDRAFMARLARAGFRATARGAKAHPGARRAAYTLIVADRPA